MRRLLGGATAAITLVAGTLLIPTPAHAAPTCTVSPLTTTCEFPYSGGTETWAVPAGVVDVAVNLFGAQGGSISTFTIGGNGGRATAQLQTAPGAVWLVSVGGAGGSLQSCDMETAPAPGGFNGGGSGGGSGSQCRGAGGGGATDIRTAGGQLTDRLLVAGGGGGSANGVDSTGPFFGGAGGGLVGQTGGSGTNGGDGGDQVGGGSGLLGLGGSGSLVGGIAGGAGGGGGGYYGGAGGRDFFGTGTTSYGGGGGSGFGPAGTTFETGVQAGNGAAQLTFPSVTLSGTAASAATHDAVQLSVSVDSNGRVDLPVQLRYGADPQALTSIIDLAPVSGTEPVTQSVPITGLTAATAYTFEVFIPGDSTTAPVSGEFSTTAAPVNPDPDPEPGPEPAPQPEPEPKPAAAPTTVAPPGGSTATPALLARTASGDPTPWLIAAFATIAGAGVLMTRRGARVAAPPSQHCAHCTISLSKTE